MPLSALVRVGGPTLALLVTILGALPAAAEALPLSPPTQRIVVSGGAAIDQHGRGLGASPDGRWSPDGTRVLATSEVADAFGIRAGRVVEDDWGYWRDGGWPVPLAPRLLGVAWVAVALFVFVIPASARRCSAGSASTAASRQPRPRPSCC